MTNLELVMEYMDRIASGDFNGALEMVSDDASFQGPQGEQMDKAAMKALFASVAPLLVNPLEQEIVGTTCEGNRVAVEARANTKLANGNTYSNLYHFLFKVEGGKIVAAHEYNNVLATQAFGEVPA